MVTERDSFVAVGGVVGLDGHGQTMVEPAQELLPRIKAPLCPTRPVVDALRRVVRPTRGEETWWQCQAQDFLDVGSPDRLGGDEDRALRRAVQLRQIDWMIQHGGKRHLRPAPPHQADEGHAGLPGRHTHMDEDEGDRVVALQC
jgi:hypothetical protein